MLRLRQARPRSRLPGFRQGDARRPAATRGAAIAFVPLDGRAGKTAGGTIETDGGYTLTTYDAGDGSMAGDFRVVITQATGREPEATPDGTKAPKAVPVLSAADRIPAIYSNHHRSPLKAKVEDRTNELNFDLKRK